MAHTIGAVRILHVVPYYADAWAYGGIPRVASAMARGLAARGHDVTVCTTDAADATSRLRGPAHRRSGGVDLRVFPNVSNHLAYHWQFFTPVGLRRFLRSAAASFDVAHIHACHNVPGAMAASALRRVRVPYVVSPNGTALRLERRRSAKLLFDVLFAGHMLPGAARVVAVTRSESRQLLTAGVSFDRIRLLPNPIDLLEFNGRPTGARFRERWGLQGRNLVLYLGKLTPRKGVDVLVRAFSQLRTPESHLVIAGNNMGAAALDRAIRESPDSRRITRVGLLRGDARLEALAAADVVVYPSRDEIFGIVPLEALLCGRPVVVCDDSGCAEVIRQVGGGDCVPYGDERALAASVDAILAKRHVWTARAADAAARIAPAFGADAVCARLEEVYEEVCA